VPGSKSITNRALVLACLASYQGACQIYGALQSEDTELMVAALRNLGFEILPEWASEKISVGPHEGPFIPAASADLFVGNSGTTMRFLAAMVSLGHGQYRLDGVPRMRERPIEDLLVALRQLGVDARSETDNGCPPVVITANGLGGGKVKIRGDVSSQFLSAVLMAAPFAQTPVKISVTGPLVSEPYIKMTLQMMEAWGLRVERDLGFVFRIQPQAPRPLEGYRVEADASAASYFFAAAAITRGRIEIERLPNAQACLQGDLAFVEVLQQMGCYASQESDFDAVSVEGIRLRGIDVDMNAISDTVMTLAAVACFAEGPTIIRNVAHIRHKETDRLTALATELRRVGAEVEEFADGLKITPRPLHGAEIETYNDHRMAMSMALIGLRVPGIVIKNPGCVAKTYPRFFEDLEKLRC
jgi:3-phosphoshikimate 1-carboxyvinyltransferase